MPNVTELLRAFDLDAIVGLDMETFYSNEYSLSRRDAYPTTEYICDPQFKTHCVSLMFDDDKKAEVYDADGLKRFARTIDWTRTGMLGHHNHFDGLIASRHFGIRPAAYFCSMSMGKPTLPISVAKSLVGMCAAFGRRAKKLGAALENVKGKRDLTPQEYKKLAAYAGHDIEDTWWLFKKILPYITLDELRVIDLTIKMYAQPTLIVDGVMTAAVHKGEVERKQKMYDGLRMTPKQLGSNPVFATALAKEGVDVPKKVKPSIMKKIKAGEIDEVRLTEKDLTYAFSKTDLDFLALKTHKRKRVRDLVAARLGVKSTLLEKRAQRMTKRSAYGPFAIYLNYAGAKTLRWSGGDKMNAQNFTRGSDLRKALCAPKGHKLLIADLAQIEARLNAWFNKQQDMLDAFAAKQDVYKIAAMGIYGKTLDKITKDERFVGKVSVLSLGYQAGGKRFAHTLRTGAMGPPVDITDSLSQSIVSAWRASNNYIVAGWKRAKNNLASAFAAGQKITDGVITYEGVHKANGTVVGFIHLPGGMSMRYDDVQVGEDGQISYLSEHKARQKGGAKTQRQKLYGGLIIENIIQALARRVIVEHLLTLTEKMPWAKFALTVHDELVFVVPNAKADVSLKIAQKVMSTPPEWAPGLPLAVDAHISDRYDK